MRIFQLALLCFICAAHASGQTSTRNYGQVVAEITKGKKKKVTAKVEVNYSLAGGDTTLASYIEKNLNETIRLKKGAKKGKYLVRVQFVLDKEGRVADIKCIQDPGYGMCVEVMRVLKKRTAWIPASPGRPVREYRR